MAKKKKVRVEFRKNRQKRRRANDLTRSFRQDDPAGADAASGERVRAKGDLSRHRTVIHETAEGDSEASASDDPSARLAVDLSTCRPGRVVRVHGLVSVVEADDGKEYRCGVRRILKTLATSDRIMVLLYWSPDGPVPMTKLKTWLPKAAHTNLRRTLAGLEKKHYVHVDPDGLVHITFLGERFVVDSNLLEPT